jgi:hypothetical protein
MKKIHLLIFLFLAFFFTLSSQEVLFNIKTSGGYISSGTVPFWFRSNQFGSVPINNASMSLAGSAVKEYTTGTNRLIDWGASFEGRMNAGNTLNFALIEGYAKIRISVFEIRGGRSKEVTGLCDTTLSSGSWSFSGNAPGIPKVEISIPDFYNIPWFGELFSFKGQFAYGWLGDHSVRWRPDTFNVKTYLHQKSLYGRFGKPGWKLKLLGGFNHQVFWGNEKSFMGENYSLSPLESYLYVISGTPYYNKDIPTSSKVGNHSGSIDVGLEFSFKKVKLLAYRQNLYEVGGLYYLSNIMDGLNGFSLENHNQNSDKIFKWKKFLFEFLYTKNQGGRPWAPVTPTPYENYYNHYAYIEGWSYKGDGLGNPFITPGIMARKDLPSWPGEYFINNRVRLFHIGLEGSVQKWDYILKASKSDNYGTYGTSDEEQSTDLRNPGSRGIFGKKEQFSFYYAGNRKLQKGFTIGFETAFDSGELLDNSFGFFVNVSKTF